jgi:protein phosphatase
MIYDIAAKSIIGTRDEQQDYMHHSLTDDGVFAVVCDGMGGMEGGSLASISAVEKIKELHSQKSRNEPYPSFLLKTVDILDECVFNLKNEEGERSGAGTTLTVAVIENNNLFWLSIGDSRLYILRENEFMQATRDHNYAMLDSESDKAEALISFIGMGGIEVMDVNNEPLKLTKNDTILLTTDGLYKALSDDEIKKCLSQFDSKSAVSRMIRKISKQSLEFQDNATFIVIKVKGVTPNETHKV